MVARCEVALLHKNTHPHRVPYHSSRNYTCASIRNTHTHMYCTEVQEVREYLQMETYRHTQQSVYYKRSERQEGLHYTVHHILNRAECSMRMLFTVLLTALTATSGEDTHTLQ